MAIAVTFVSYGVSEIMHCYGFFAVFVTALTVRNSHRDHDFQRAMHDITEQIERITMMLLLLGFGGAIANSLLSAVGWIEIAAALLVLLVVRPVTGLTRLIGTRATTSERLFSAFFGIRGVGSFYYLAYGINHGDFADGDRLW